MHHVIAAAGRAAASCPMEIDQIFVGIHIRVTRLVASLVPPLLRSALLFASLLLSLFLLTSLVWLHHQHINPLGTHYHALHEPWEEDQPQPQQQRHTTGAAGFPSLLQYQRDCDILRIEIVPPSPDYQPWTGTGWSGWWDNTRHITIRRDTAAEQRPPPPPTQQQDAVDDAEGSSVSAPIAAWWPSSLSLRLFSTRVPNFSSAPPLSRHSPGPSPSLSLSSSSPWYASRVYQYEWAQHKGYFLLPSSLYAQHDIIVTTVVLPASHEAFGPFPLSLFTFHLFGYDSIVLNHLIRQMRSGFMRTAHTGDIYTIGNNDKSQQQPEPQPELHQQQPLQSIYNTSSSFSSAPASALPPPLAAHESTQQLLPGLRGWLSRALHVLYLAVLKAELLITTLFLFFATTTLVSSTLTQTQLRMLAFTDQLRQHLRLHLPIIGLVLEHTMQSLSFVPVVVGILFFLFEFFQDQIMAFLLLMLVWLCESYTVLFTRCTTSMLYFPRLFAVYFVMFGVYFFSFPYGFHYVAIALTASQLYTAMAYYAFCYEIPAVERGDISIHRPRMLVLRRSEGGDGRTEGGREGRGEQMAEAGPTAAQQRQQPGTGRQGEVLAQLLGLWDERQQQPQQQPYLVQQLGQRLHDAEDDRAEADRRDDHDAHDGLEFSRRQLRTSRGLPSSSTSASASVQPRVEEDDGSGMRRWAVAVAAAVPAVPSSSPVAFRATFPLSRATSAAAAVSSVGTAADSRADNGLSVSIAPPSSSSAAALLSLSPVDLSPPPSGATAAAAVSVPPLSSSSPSSSSSDQNVLQHLQSLQALLSGVIKNTQLLKAAYAPSSPCPSHPTQQERGRRRSRALSGASASPTSSPLPASRTGSLTLSPLAAFQETKEELPPPPPPPAPGVEGRELQRAVLDQLAYVLQVSLFVLTTLMQAQPQAQSPSAGPASGDAILVSSLPSLQSMAAAAPSSPRPPASPRTLSTSPVSSPQRSLPHQVSAVLARSPRPSAAARRLVLPRSLACALSTAPSDLLMEQAQRHGATSGIRMEPMSPDPASDAPMM